MSLDADLSQPPAPLYARFSRRLRGIMVDWVIAMAAIFGAAFAASMVRNDDFSRVLGVLVVVGLLLYEPLLVSITGGTLGHRATNLRVVDDRGGGNVSFAKACARVAIKGLLGWYSFMVLALTRRNQAIHDLLTRSTVQIRDPAGALPGQYITERAGLPAAGMPSRLRRAGIICVYLLMTVFGYFLIWLAVMATGLISRRCVMGEYCSQGESVFTAVIGLIPLAVAVVVIVLGWQGRLFGARRSA